MFPWAAIAGLLFVVPGACGDPEVDLADELPRIAPVEPADAAKRFQTVDGIRIELAAAEPLVVDPIAMAFDEYGRLFVVEMPDYSENADGRLGRVRLLTDLDGDGRYDRATVYVDGMSWPTAVACWDGGVFVGAAPHLLYCKDLDGDGQADLRRRVYTGFGRSNVQGLMNTLLRGQDNRFHGAVSSSGATLRRADRADGPAVKLSRLDFALDPRTLSIEPISGGAQHGASFDEVGRRFVCSNSDHLQQIVYPHRYALRNPYVAAPPARVSIAADGPQAPVYRISPIEPWRVVRTRLRVAGAVPGPIEGGGKPAGYFTGSTGVTICRGDALPAEMRGMAIIGDVGSNIVHRKRLEPNGLEMIGRRVDERAEMLASSDIWFRPVQFANGPDGALYIADMYREVIEHPASLPPSIKRHLDLESGNDRGRIWRVTAAGHERRAIPPLGDWPTERLVDLLAHSNAWHHETAARLIYERRDPAAVEPLRRLLRTSPAPLGRMRALYALDGLEALRPDDLLDALRDTDPWVRTHAVRLSESVAGTSPRLRDRLVGMADDPALHVRFQLAFTLGEIEHERREASLVDLLRRDGADAWMRFAVLSSLGRGALDAVRLITADERLLATEHGRDVLIQLVGQVGREGDDADRRTLREMLHALPDGLAEAAGSALEQGAAKGPARQNAAIVPAPEEPTIGQAERERRDARWEQLQAALDIDGDADTGRRHFRQLCASCHRLEDVGNAVGPNLAAFAARGREAILLNVVDPDREVNPLYTLYVARLADGETVAGMIGHESATAITMTLPDGSTRTMLRADVARIESIGRSLMPADLTAALDERGVADLLAYLVSQR